MDEQTLQEARRGSRDALAVLLRELQDPWYRMSLSLLGNAEAAVDATQETALRFLGQLKSFRGESQLRTWSLGICLNVVREMRRRDRRRDLLDESFAQSLADVSPPPDVSAQQAEDLAALRQMLAALPQRQREAVVLRYFEDLSIEQTARVMQCAHGTIKASVHQALRTLRRQFVVMLL